MSKESVGLYHISFTYPDRREPVFSDLSVSFPERGLFLIRGQSGFGKSTLLSMMSGSLVPDEGIVSVFGENLGRIAEKDRITDKIAYIRQQPLLLDGLSPEEHLRLAHPEWKQEKRDRMLAYANLSECGSRICKHLSKGERQRAAIMMQIADEKKIILCDEITTDLDYDNKMIVLDLLKGISSECLVICVSHEIQIYEDIVDGILILEDGKLRWEKNGDTPELPATEEKDVGIERQGKRILPFLFHRYPYHRVRTLLSTVLSLLISFFCFSCLRIGMEEFSYSYYPEIFQERNNFLITDLEEERIPETYDGYRSFGRCFSYQMETVYTAFPMHFSDFSFDQEFGSGYSVSFTQYCFKDDIFMGGWSDDEFDVCIGVNKEKWSRSSLEKMMNKSFTLFGDDAEFRVSGFYDTVFSQKSMNGQMVISFKTIPVRIENYFKHAILFSCGANQSMSVNIYSSFPSDTIMLPSRNSSLFVKTLLGLRRVDLSGITIQYGNDFRMNEPTLTKILSQTGCPNLLFYDNQESMKKDFDKGGVVDPGAFLQRWSVHREEDDVLFVYETAILLVGTGFIVLFFLVLQAGDKTYKSDMKMIKILELDSSIRHTQRMISFVLMLSAMILASITVFCISFFLKLSWMRSAWILSLCYTCLLKSAEMMVRSSYD